LKNIVLSVLAILLLDNVTDSKLVRQLVIKHYCSSTSLPRSKKLIFSPWQLSLQNLKKIYC